VPVENFDEPYWGHGGSRCIWCRFRREDGQPLMLAGLWNEGTDAATGEVIPSYTMFTVNCNAHPLLSLMHRPDFDPAGRPLRRCRTTSRTSARSCRWSGLTGNSRCTARQPKPLS